MIEKIKNIVMNYGRGDPRNYTFIFSNLCWDRVENAIQFLVNFIPLNAKVLELGCGYGHTTAMLATFRKDIKIIGTDLMKSPTWDYFTEFGCLFEECNAADIPLGFKEFDIVISFGVIEHVGDDIKFLKEVYRCLKKGGYNIIINLPNRYSLPEFLAKMCGIVPHKQKYTKREAINLLENNGFKVINVIREHFLPAQVHVISDELSSLFNISHKLLFGLDNIICKHPLSLFSQDFRIISQKC